MGNGKQIRSFLYIDDCIRGTNLLFKSNYRYPINIGNNKHVTINELVAILEKITGHKVKKLIGQNQKESIQDQVTTRLLKKC